MTRTEIDKFGKLPLGRVVIATRLEWGPLFLFKNPFRSSSMSDSN